MKYVSEIQIWNKESLKPKLTVHTYATLFDVV